MSDPWFKFFPTNWRSDPGLRSCGLAARGLWMDMLAIMHEATPRGDLLVNGLAVTSKQLAALCGCTVDEVETALSELENAGVFSRRRNGIIYSRKMERDEIKARKNRDNGKMGGNPNLSKQTEIKESVNPPDKAKKLEARSKIDRVEGASLFSPKDELLQVLDEQHAVWVIEHRQRLRKPLTARAANQLAGKLGKCPDPNAAADLMIEKGWSSIEAGWVTKNQPVQKANGQKPGKRVEDYTEADWQGWLEYCRPRSEWLRHLGPPPFSPGCKAPAHLLIEKDRRMTMQVMLDA